ncbi:MAG: dTMP kinase [Chloroflexota bacterium]
MIRFITLEGPEGGGKTTHARLLADHLQTLGLDVLLSREPGGTPIGDSIRRTLMDAKHIGMTPEAEFLLFCASRAQLVRQVLRPALAAGRTVVLDRFYDSSLAYQGYGHQLDLDTLRAVTRFVTDGLAPDLTLLLDLPVETGLARKQREGEWNRLDAYDLEFHQRVRQGYAIMAAAEPERWIPIDADRSLEAVQADIRRAVAERLGLGR